MDLSEILETIDFQKKIISQEASEEKYIEGHQDEDFLIKRQKRELIKKYSSNSFILFCIWLTVVLLMVMFDGFNFLGFSLREAVMIVLLSTTTVNVISLLAIVFSYIFYIQDKEPTSN
jgi:hypothetical protein